jgi:ankyrin repeat protein
VRLPIVGSVIALFFGLIMPGCGHSNLRRAIDERDWDQYKRLLDNGTSPNTVEGGSAVIHVASTMDDSKWLKSALSHGGDANLINTGNEDYPDDTPIFYAIGMHRSENVRLLIEAGADLAHQDNLGHSPFYEAVDDGDYEIALMIAKAGANIYAKDKRGQDAIHILKDFRTPGAMEPEQHRQFLRLVDFLNKRGAEIRIGK